MIKHLQSKNGFTLVEIIVTIAILLMIVLPIMTMLLTGAKLNRQSKIELEASELATKYMEKIKSWDKLYPNYNTKEFNEGDYRIAIDLSKLDAYENQQPNISGDSYDLTIESDEFGDFIFKGNGLSFPSVAKKDEIDIEFNDNGYRIDSAGQVTYNFNNSISPHISIKINTDLIINAKNETNKVFNIDILKDDLVASKCTINVLKGDIKKSMNIYSQQIEKSADNVLYKAVIKVFYKGEEIISMDGYKVFD